MTPDELLNSLFREEIKQKEFIELYTTRCEVDGLNIFCFMGTKWILREQFYMSFTLTNDHIERDNSKWKEARFNFDGLNFN